MWNGCFTTEYKDLLAFRTKAVRYHKKNNNKRAICFPFSAPNKYLIYSVATLRMVFSGFCFSRVLRYKRATA